MTTGSGLWIPAVADTLCGGGLFGYAAPSRSAVVLVRPSDGRVCHVLVPNWGLGEDGQDGVAFATSGVGEDSCLPAALVH